MPLLRKADYVTLAGLVFGGGLILLALVWINGCASNKDAFTAEVASCEAATTCAAAVECRRMVAAKYRRPFTGRCEPIDAGGQ